MYDETLLDEYIRAEVADARGHGYRTDIDVRYHDHSSHIECECHQFETDHHPAYVINGEAGEVGRWGEPE